MNKKTHLTSHQRSIIESLLHEQYSIRYIADILNKAPSTISREIHNHIVIKIPNSCNCSLSGSCNVKHICGSEQCNKKCKSCKLAKKYCEFYDDIQCQKRIQNNIGLCNSCSQLKYCRKPKHFYDAELANKAYKEKLSNTRNGFDLTYEDFVRIDTIVSPLVKRGQSLYHIVKSNAEQLRISESTLRRLIDAKEMSVINLDLPEKVKRKQRRKRKPVKTPPVIKTGHLYKDYIEYLENNDTFITEMDCVEGKKEDEKAILTLHNKLFHMQLAFLLERQDSYSVISCLDDIEKRLGKLLFHKCFPLILTDNGQEFSDISAIERSIFGGKRTKVFFCDPNRSDQKGSCEANHKLIRKIIPKGTSIQKLTQEDMILVTNNINSYVRKSLFDKSPYDIAMVALPGEFFQALSLTKIDSKEVNMTPNLLKHRK